MPQRALSQYCYTAIRREAPRGAPAARIERKFLKAIVSRSGVGRGDDSAQTVLLDPLPK